jgi:hypothetical protein
MSRKQKSGKTRHEHRERLRLRREVERLASPSAPARLHFFGKVRSGDVAELSLHFPAENAVPVDMTAEDPSEALPEAMPVIKQTTDEWELLN